jgi:beta-phosphoglucomutase-like phosphatase (HAD superfamily)
MNRAFIFDMDGVLIDSEPYWAQFEGEFLERMFGSKIANEIGHGPEKHQGHSQ